MKNILEHPEEAKYRTIKKTNSVLQQRLAFPGCIDLLKALGWVEVGDNYVLDVSSIIGLAREFAKISDAVDLVDPERVAAPPETNFSPAMLALVNEHVFTGMQKQLSFGDVIGSFRNWNLDVPEPTTLRFTYDDGQVKRFQVQILGTYSNFGGSWMWAHANTQSRFPASSLLASNALLQYGQRHQISEFTERCVCADESIGHVLGLVALGLLQASAYYRCPHAQGYAIVMLTDAEVDARLNITGLRASTVMTQTISAPFGLTTHYPGVVNLLKACKLKLTESPTEVIGTDETGEEVAKVTFDARGCVVQHNCRA
eukprot:TRINITY_DN7736_c0_g1_i1.p2 TRINITY_DN7736_c0_g1~~TRINITY_DN7736_c0_g1_i1.p2  ORF type:complete len:353 (-),score=83.13 TRINITY_DN7736_c0_g1_i1:1740-2681(-)